MYINNTHIYTVIYMYIINIIYTHRYTYIYVYKYIRIYMCVLCVFIYKIRRIDSHSILTTICVLLRKTSILL